MMASDAYDYRHELAAYEEAMMHEPDDELIGLEEHLRDEGTREDYVREAYSDPCPGCGAPRYGADCPNCFVDDEVNNSQCGRCGAVGHITSLCPEVYGPRRWDDR